MRALTPEQRCGRCSPPSYRELFTAAFRDNFEMKFEGIRAGDLGSAQQRLLLDVLATLPVGASAQGMPKSGSTR